MNKLSLNRKILIYISIISIAVIYTGCRYFTYKIKIDDINDLKRTISSTEHLIKKIDRVPPYKDQYVSFNFYNGSTSFNFSTLNYNPNDSIVEGRNNPNYQSCVDTCKVIPGLTSEEWNLLRQNLHKLNNHGIKGGQAYFCRSLITNGKDICECDSTEFWFFCYDYIFPQDSRSYFDVGCLALIPDSIINIPCFERFFKIMDKQEGVYLIKRKI